jgi:transposase-like protein
VIRLMVVMYVRFPLSLRNVEDLLFERGIDICHETVRMWWNRFGRPAALSFMKKALKRHGQPETITTDGLRSYRAAMTQPDNAHRQKIGRWANNRVENSHLPFRRRERAMLRFRQMKSLQKFASVHASMHNHFNQERHLVDRKIYSVC